MARSVQITPGLAPGSSYRLDLDARAKSLSPSTLLRLAIEKVYPGSSPAVATAVAPLDWERCPDGAWVQRVTSISPESLAQIEHDRKRLKVRRRVALIRAVIELTYPPSWPGSE